MRMKGEGKALPGRTATRFRLAEPIPSGDLVRRAEQFPKWSYEIRRAEEAPVAARRALQVALTPPTGPVFLSLPMDLMGPAVEDTGVGPTPIATRTRPAPGAVARAAELLAGAGAPIVIAGDGVARSQAVAELTALAELSCPLVPG